VTEENPAAERLLRAREAVASEYKLDINDWQVRRLALLMSVFSHTEDQAANGRTVDIGALLALDKSIQDVRETIKKTEPITVNIKFVPGKHIACPKCEHEFDPTTKEPAKPLVLRTRCPHCNKPSEVSPFESSNPDITVPQAPPAANVVPLVSHRPGVSASSFHSQVMNGREVPPLKREQPSHYRSEAAERERHPYRDSAGGNRSVAHPLPVPHGVIW